MKNVPADALDKLLGKIFKDVRKQNGAEYEPDSLSSFQRSIQCRLKELKLSFNILKDEEFCRSREVLAAKRKNLVKQGRGNKPNPCRELTSEEEEKSFESGAFGFHNPEALQRTLWWFFSLHFGFRARDESRKLCWGDLELQIDPETGREIFSWFGWQKERARLPKDWKVHTSDILIRKYLPREQSSAQSDISRFSKATVLKKRKPQLPLSFWP